MENRPHLVGGFSQHTSFGNDVSSSSAAGSRFSLDLLNLKSSQLDASGSILSMAEKYTYMRETCRKRLVFGKQEFLNLTFLSTLNFEAVLPTFLKFFFFWLCTIKVTSFVANIANKKFCFPGSLFYCLC